MYRYRERNSDCSSDSDEEGLLSIGKLNKKVQNDPETASSLMDMESKPEVHTINKTTKRKVNNIWATIAQEQTINEDLCKVNMNRITDRIGWDRGCESYDFTRKEKDERSDPETDEEIDLDYGVSDIENEFEESVGEKPVKKTASKVPLVERSEDANKIARELAWKLQEPKVQLLERTIQVLGRKKVFDLLHVTEDIEESGGMLILNGSRRRTPGGVFFFQLRKDKRITKKQKDFIFAEDNAKYVEHKKAFKKLKKKNQKKSDKKPAKMDMEVLENTGNVSENSTEPPVPVANEVPDAKPTEQTSDVELEEGEIE